MKDWQDPDKFSDSIRDKVYEQAESPEAGLWNKLETRLDAMEPPPRRRGAWFWLPVLLVSGLAAWSTYYFSGHPSQTTENISEPRPEANIPSSSASAIKDAGPRTLSPQENIPSSSSIKNNTPVPADKKEGADAPAEKASRPALRKKASQKPATHLPDYAEHVPPVKNEIPATEVPLIVVLLRDSSQLEVLDISLRQAGLMATVMPAPLLNLSERITLPQQLPPVSWFSIAIVNNLNYSITRYRAGDHSKPAMLDNAKVTRDMSSSRANFSAGFSAAMKLNHRLMLSAGIRMSSYSEKYSYDFVKAAYDPYNSAVQNPNYNGDQYRHAGDSIISGNKYSFVNRYYCREVPVLICWYIPMKGKWHAFLEGGISFIKISHASAAYLDADRVGFIVAEDVESYPGFRMMYNLNMNMGMAYRLNPKISFEIAPSLRYGLNSMIKDPSWTQQTPSFVGVNVAMRRHF